MKFFSSLHDPDAGNFQHLMITGIFLVQRWQNFHEDPTSSFYNKQTNELTKNAR